MNAPNTTPAAEIPSDFTLDDLKAALSEEEISALGSANDGIDMPFEITEAGSEEIDPTIVVVEHGQTDTQTQGQQPALEQAQAPAPLQMAEVPDTTEAEAKVADLQNRIEQLATQYDEGVLTRPEWLAQQNALVAQQAQAHATISRAADVVSKNREAVVQAFYAEQNKFKANGNEILWSPEHINGWDSALRSITGNATYAALPPDRQIELAADFYAADYRARTGKALNITAGAKAAKDLQQATEPLKVKDTPRDDAPVTLAGLNGDANATMTDGTLETMMRLDPEKAEAMFDRMTPAQQEALLASV